MASDTSEGKVYLGSLEQHIKRTGPAFSPQWHGHAGMLDMLFTYDMLTFQKAPSGHWSVCQSLGVGGEDTIEVDPPHKH